MGTTQTASPVETDMALSSCYEDLAKLDLRIASRAATLIRKAGADYHYVGRRRLPNLTIEQAIIRIEERLARPTDVHQLGLARGFYLRKDAMRDLAEYRDLLAQRQDQVAEIEGLDALYTGWSRFFLVTSSNGHIHSSMNCSTCRPTTTYGWMPNLSGKAEAEAIGFFGPAAECLCSVCFPDAPVANKDQNLTAKQMEALLAGRTCPNR